MTSHYPYKFNVSTLEYDDVAAYLQAIPSSRYTIARREFVGDLTLEEWRSVQRAITEKANTKLAQTNGRSTSIERSELLDTDSDEAVDIDVLGHPARASRRLLNRVAIQVGLDHAGVSIANKQSRVELRRGVEGYLVQFKEKNDALMFKLAMWKRPTDVQL